MSQSPWRVFWFPLKKFSGDVQEPLIGRNPLGGSFGFHRAENILIKIYDFCRNPLGGSFGFHRINLSLLKEFLEVAIPLAGLLVSTVYGS